MNKNIYYVISMLLCFFVASNNYAMMEKVRWKWLDTWHPDQSKEADQACAATRQMLLKVVELSVKPVFEKHLVQVIEEIQLAMDVCALRKDAHWLGELNKNKGTNFQAETLLRKSDDGLVRAWKQVEERVALLEKVAQENK